MPEKKKLRRLRRSESFFGLHFDFHAGPDCADIGARLTEESLRELLEKVKPDYVQCDSKGHPGFSSYPTKTGYAAPGFVKDPLRVWRKVTAGEGVALYVHYSGVWDTEALKHHPEWARIDENGKADPNNISVFGPYVDELLIPQLKELCTEYAVDGIWLDGECWAVCQDYHPEVLAAFTVETGITEIPRSVQDPHFHEFTEFCREGFRKYLAHYVSELHRHDPGFQIASNWAYTSYMPEKPGSGVDFISGDYPMKDSVNMARLEARCLLHQELPWDLMAWSFCADWGENCFCTKSVEQMKQEAAVVLALGGGFQIYSQQRKDASIVEAHIGLLAEVAAFCRERQEFCHQATPVPQIALLYSSASYYRNNERLFSAWKSELVSPVRGILQNLLDRQQVVDVLMDHHLKDKLEAYPLLIIPEWDTIDDADCAHILAYVCNGGNLLLIGPASVRLFEAETGVVLNGEPESLSLWLDDGAALGGIETRLQRVELTSAARCIGQGYLTNDRDSAEVPLAAVCTLGKGRIASIFCELGKRYLSARTPAAGNFLNHIVRELMPEPVVEVIGSSCVDVICMQKDGHLLINLINTAGPHADPSVNVFNEIPVTGPLEIRIRCGRQTPGSVMLQPEGLPLAYREEAGIMTVDLGRLEIHHIIEVCWE